MNITELIDELTTLAEDHGGDTEVRLAIQPSWPFQHDIASVIGVELGGPESPCCDARVEREGPSGFACTVCGSHLHDDEVEEPDDSETIVYIAEGGQHYDAPYLPGAAQNELGWGR